eukprot:m51a1_g9645 hypothetical protein (235) ;mRNA; f:1169409-1170193
MGSGSSKGSVQALPPAAQAGQDTGAGQAVGQTQDLKLVSFTEKPAPAPVLVLYAHPNPKSFCHAILEQLEKVLHAHGKKYVVRDLYAMHFNPVLGPDDFGSKPSDVALEQQYVQAAEHIVVIHPVWWFSFPAILKGYFDRVFSYGFAFGPSGSGGTEGKLKGKKATIVSTAGASKEVYDSAAAALKFTMEGGLLQYCGIDVVEHHYCCSVTAVSADDRAKMLQELDAKFTALLA